jgi:5-methylcytosine-specific restriction endonuclease McrA
MDCPTCEKSLNTEGGMRQHHTQVHDDPLPNRTCKGCATEFYDPKSQRSYCDDCNPQAGEHNGNYQNATETTTCDACGDQFEYYPSDKDGIWCPACVDAADGLLPENPIHVDPVRVACEFCGRILEVGSYRVNRAIHGVFCSNWCHARWMSREYHGPRHHCWEGKGETRGPGWKPARQRVLKRDDHECQLCGKGKEEIGRNPDVHHIEPLRTFDDLRDAHTLSNLISLCHSCHMRVEHGDASVPGGGNGN